MADRQTYFTRFKMYQQLIKKLAGNMKDTYENMEHDYHPSDLNSWKPFDPSTEYWEMVKSAQWSGANADDVSMDFELDDPDLEKWEDLLDHINKTIEDLS